MDEEKILPKEKNKSHTHVSIIPSNYSKSHRLNADQLGNCVSNSVNETSSETPISSSLSSTPKNETEEAEIECKRIISKKKIRRNKLKEETQANSKTTQSEMCPEEPKPRIVLTFRSEKSGSRSSNVKIISPDEKNKNKETNMRRSTRFRATCDKSNSNNEDVELCASAKRSPRKHNNMPSDSDEAEYSAPPLKRSNRRRSKDISETVLANAIARKEKSYEQPTTQRLITRPVKPTAKVLANKELKLSLESTNSARLGTEKSPDETRPRRSSRRRIPLGQSSRDGSCSPKNVLKSKRSRSNKADESDDEVLKQNENYLTVDEIKHALGGIAPTSKVSLRAEDDDRARENYRFNKLKKKHFSKLGLRAVPATKQNVTNSNENLTDESTMDSTNTDAIVEHLNEQKKQIEAEQLRAQQMLQTADLEGEEQEYDDDDSELLSLLKEGSDNGGVEVKASETDTSDEEFAYTRGRVNVAATPRVTRKTARLQQPHDITHSDNSDEERADCSSPAGGDEGSVAAAPSEGAHCFAACLCTSVSNVYMQPEALTEPVFCRAVELVNGARVGCSHRAMRDADGQYSALQRASVRVPFFLTCALHSAQMQLHLCCPVCGVFCTQGVFHQCSRGHLFHTECGVWAGSSPAREGAPGCPHCGEDPREGVALNRDCHRVRVDMKCSNKQIFIPDQRVQYTPAFMSFAHECDEVSACPLPASLLPPAPVSLTSLRLRGEAAADFDELLTSTPESRLAGAVASVHDAEHVLIKLLNGVDLHSPIETADGGTFLHLAAKHGNLTATYLLHNAGCKLDGPDLHLKTPLMVAVLALATLKEDSEKTANEDKKKKEKKIEEDEKGIINVMRYLLAAGCDVNYQGAEGVSALHLAAQHGLASAGRVLLESHRVRVDVADHGGWSPLVWAAENKHPALVRALLTHGADASGTDAEGNSVLHWCVLAGCAASLQLILDASHANAVNTVNPHGDTLLHVASRQDHYACVVILLARGGRTDMKNSSGELAVDCAQGEARTAISLNMQMSLMAKDKPWRYKLLSSDISNGREDLPVSCVNSVDDAALPTDFTYVTRHVLPQYVKTHSTLASIQGCSCESEACGAGAACSCCVLGVRRWYAEGRLVSDFPFKDAPMIFECNETCKCNLKQCPNAVVTRLSRRGAVFVRAQVFRCREPRGWGLRTCGAVPRGAPVALYSGELLKASVADTRPRDQYMFAMEVKQDLLVEDSETEQLCVDAGNYGSAARFINHSCLANLAPVRVFTNSRDVRAPNIVLFATRHIAPLEELTFNYGDKFWSVKSRQMKCACGAPNCRYSVNMSDAAPATPAAAASPPSVDR